MDRFIHRIRAEQMEAQVIEFKVALNYWNIYLSFSEMVTKTVRRAAQRVVK